MADVTAKHCPKCKSNVMAVRPSTNHALHLCISFFTLGMWIPIWILSSVKFGGWKCPTCGGSC
jgi:hypothetical protein